MVAENEKPSKATVPFPRKIYREIHRYKARVFVEQDRKISLNDAIVELVERGLNSIENN